MSAARWQKTLGALIVALAALAPLAVFLRAYDPGALRDALFQLAALAALFAWALKSLERGRFELPEALWPVILPAAGIAAWAAARCALDGQWLTGFPQALRQALGFFLFLTCALELGGHDVIGRLSGAALTAGWAVALYGAWQAVSAAHQPVAATFLRPELLGLYLGLCAPLVAFKRLDEERDGWLKRLDLALLALCAAVAAATGSFEALLGFAVPCLSTAAFIAAMIPSRAARREALLSLLAAIGACAGGLAFNGPALAADAAFAFQYKSLMWPAAARAALAAPLLGRGFSAEASALAGQAPQAVLALTGSHGALLGPSSALLETVVTGGLLAAALRLWLAGALWAAAWRARRSFARAASVGELGALAALCAAVFGLAGVSLFGQASPAAFGWLFWPLAGCLAGLTQLAPKSRVVRVLPVFMGDGARRRVYAGAALVFVGLSILPGRWLAGEVSLNQGVAAARAQDWTTAEKDFAAVMPGSPDYLAAQYMLGNALLQAGDAKAALAQYARLDSLSPDYALVNFYAAQACARGGDWSGAVARAKRQRDLDGGFVENEALLADAAQMAGDLALARQAALTAVSLSPNDPLRWLELSKVYARQRKIGEAARIRRMARRLRRAQDGGADSRPRQPEG